MKSSVGPCTNLQVTAGMLSNGRKWEAKGELKGGAGPPAADVAEELLEDANCGGSPLVSRCAADSCDAWRSCQQHRTESETQPAQHSACKVQCCGVAWQSDHCAMHGCRWDNGNAPVLVSGAGHDALPMANVTKVRSIEALCVAAAALHSILWPQAIYAFILM